MKKYLLTIDQGTTSSRAIIFDENIEMIAMAQKEFPNYFPQPGWVEQDAMEIYDSVKECIFSAIEKANIKFSDLSGVGITNQRETTIVWEKETGRPVYNALVWQSRQTASLCEERKEYEEFISEKTGLIMDPYFSSSKIRWILDHIENGQEKAERGELLFGTVDSWLVYNLTGKKIHVTEVSNASRTQLMDLETLNWDKELCDIWNIPMCMLPKICSTSEIYGYTDASVYTSEVPICAMVGDQQASLFGQACFSEGDVKNTYGTGCFLLMNVGKEKKCSNHGLVTTVAWKIKDEVNYALEGSVFVAGAAVQWLRDGLKMIETSSESNVVAAEVEDSDGVYVVPAFTGLGAPYWDANAKGAVFGLTRGTTKAHFVRATIESLAYQTADVLKAMEQDTNLSITNVKVDGGASKSDLLLQFQADILNASIIRAKVTETTALGATFLAGLACGVFKDQNEIAQRWQSDKIFKPEMEKTKAEQLMNGWHKAVKATQIFE